MGRLVALALSRPQPIAPALPAPGRRAVALAGVTAALLLALYGLAARTPIFAVRTVEVTGVPPALASEVREAAESMTGTSLVGLDGEALARRLEAIPAVRSVEYDRAFPSTLRLAVEPERPLAVVRLPGGAWLVSEEARVLRAVELRSLPRLPRIRAEAGASIAPGDRMTLAAVRVPLGALSLVPPSFPLRVLAARGDGTTATLFLSGGAELRLGSSESWRLGLRVAGRVLAALPPDERAALAYLDVSLPERPVAAVNAQPEIEG